MKKILIFIILLNAFLAFYALPFKKEINTFQVVSIKPEIKVYSIEEHLNSMLIKYNRKWTPLDKKIFIETMEAGTTHYNIHPKIVMSIIEIESNFKIKAYNKNKNSIDYGLSQINSKNWDTLSNKSKKILDEYNIKYTNSKYNIALNVMNSFSYLDWSKKTLENKGFFTYPKLIKSYNVGVNGSLSKSKNYKRIREQYFEKFIASYNSHL